jgi:hypothetical protein
LIDLLGKILQALVAHFISSEEKLPEPRFTNRPILGGLQSIKGSDSLIIGHHKDRALLDAFPTTGAAINLNHLFERKF